MENSIIMYQGESFLIPLQLTRDDEAVSADLLEEMEICVGGIIHRKMSSGGIILIEGTDHFGFIPTQAETLAMKPGDHAVTVRVKFTDTPPIINIGVVGAITILPTGFEEEI